VELNFCPACGGFVRADWVTCRACGQPLDNVETKAQETIHITSPAIRTIAIASDINEVVEETPAVSPAPAPTSPPTSNPFNDWFEQSHGPTPAKVEIEEVASQASDVAGAEEPVLEAPRTVEPQETAELTAELELVTGEPAPEFELGASEPVAEVELVASEPNHELVSWNEANDIVPWEEPVTEAVSWDDVVDETEADDEPASHVDPVETSESEFDATDLETPTVNDDWAQIIDDKPAESPAQKFRFTISSDLELEESPAPAPWASGIPSASPEPASNPPSAPEPARGEFPPFETTTPDRGGFPSFEVAEPGRGGFPSFDSPAQGETPLLDSPVPGRGGFPAFEVAEPGRGGFPSFDPPTPNATTPEVPPVSWASAVASATPPAEDFLRPTEIAFDRFTFPNSTQQVVADLRTDKRQMVEPTHRRLILVMSVVGAVLMALIGIGLLSAKSAPKTASNATLVSLPAKAAATKATSAQESSGWINYNEPQGRFSIDFPGQPTVTTTGRMTMWQAKTPDGSAIANVYIQPAPTGAQDTGLNAAIDSDASDLNATVKSRSISTVSNRRQISAQMITTSSQGVEMVTFVQGSQLCTVAVVSNDSNGDPALFDRLTSTFQPKVH
jgi:hypothetical protein